MARRGPLATLPETLPMRRLALAALLLVTLSCVPQAPVFPTTLPAFTDA